VFLDAKLSHLCVGLKTNENITGKIWGVIVFLMGKALPCCTKEDLAMGLKLTVKTEVFVWNVPRKFQEY
jgi:hypothetical protein